MLGIGLALVIGLGIGINSIFGVITHLWLWRPMAMVDPSPKLSFRKLSESQHATVPRQSLWNVQDDGFPFLSFKAPDPRKAVLASRHKPTVVVSILNAVNAILTQQKSTMCIYYNVILNAVNAILTRQTSTMCIYYNVIWQAKWEEKVTNY